MTPPQCAYTDGKTYFDRKGRLDDWESGHDGGANQLFCLFNFQCQDFFLKKNKNFKKKKKKGVVKKERELPRGGIKYVSETGTSAYSTYCAIAKNYCSFCVIRIFM